MKKSVYFLCAVLVLPFTALANKPDAAPIPPAAAEAKARSVSLTAGCKYQENVTLNVTLNSREKSVKEAKETFEKRVQEIEEFAKKSGVTNMKLSSMNYNINTQPQYSNGVVSGMQDFNLSGNIGYQMDDADVAAALMEELASKNIQSSMSVNSYRNQPCASTGFGIIK